MKTLVTDLHADIFERVLMSFNNVGRVYANALLARNELRNFDEKTKLSEDPISEENADKLIKILNAKKKNLHVTSTGALPSKLIGNN